MDVKVQVQNEQWEPLASVVIEAYKLADNTIMEKAMTDRAGVATFKRLPDPDSSSYGFRARITRSSGKNDNLSLNGVVHLQLMPSAPKEVFKP